MFSPLSRRSVLCALSLLGALAHESLSAAAGPKPGPVAYVMIETSDLSIEFAGDRAWTISRIVHRGKAVTERVGFYGTVFSPQGGHWIGTGHNEGGIEKVESATLTVDGKPCELADKAVYRGQRAELRKHSMMGPIRLEAIYIVDGDSVLEQHRYEMTEEVKIGTMYAFMHPFLPSTTEWLAETADGQRLEGRFDSEGGNKLSSDVKWTAIFDPASNRVTLAWYPTAIQGEGKKTFYWDKTVYHKLYNQLYSQSTVPAGTKVETRVVIRPAETTPENWKERALELVRETQARITQNKLSFP